MNPKLLEIGIAKPKAAVARQGRGMVELTIDGLPVAVSPGTTILDAARSVGIDIPVLCHQSNERPVGVCRVCSVEAGEKTLTAACTRPVETGMSVRTNTSKVKRARSVLLELLISEHPSPCIRQQRSGDCELETLAEKSGVFVSRFPAPPTRRRTDDSSVSIAVDHDACILCDRCIRACNEVRHNYVIGRSGKGYDAKIAFDLNDPMGSSSCVSCGECMVSCPTGALTNKVVIPAELPDGEPVEVRFLKGLPYFADISSTFLQLNRNAVVLRRFSPGEIVCREGDYGSTAFLILEGRAEMFLHPRVNPPSGKPATGRSFKKWLSFVSGESVELSEQPLGIGHPSVGSVELGPGDLFAEGSCVSHYPRSETVRAVTACVTLEILRNVLDTMLARNGEFRKLLDGNFRQRAMRAHLLSTPLFSGVSEASIDRLKDIAQLVSVARAEVIFEEGSPADCFYVVRSGFAKLRAKRAGGEVVLAYIGPRQTLGFDAGPSRTAAATALERMDLIRFDRREVDELLGASGEDRERFAVRSERPDNPGPAHIALERFLDTGLMSAGSVLILDLERCTRCDACVRACAEAHEGVTRLVREGVRFDKYLVATSCRQCRDPLCMAGCPVGSIRRRTSLEIVIEDWCIGCGLCADNCPYGNIHMHPVQPAEGSLSGLIAARPAVKQKATACDLCSDLAEPSCVYACPHDAAKRVDAASFFGLLPQ